MFSAAICVGQQSGPGFIRRCALAALVLGLAYGCSIKQYAAVPDHRGLLLAAALGFTQYAYVFVQIPADELEEQSVAGAYEQRARARRMYIRARDYGLRWLGFDSPASLQGLLGLTAFLYQDRCYFTAPSPAARV